MADEPAKRQTDDEEPTGSTEPTERPPGFGGDESSAPEKIDAKPILEIEEDLCPKCQSVLRPGEVVCVRCGFDLRKNAALEPSIGVEHVSVVEQPPEGPRAMPRSTPVVAEPAGVGGAKAWWGRAVAGVGAVAGPKQLREEFSTPGRGSVQTLLMFAAALVVSAMVIAGIDAPTGRFGPTAGRVVLTLYEAILATGLGLAAVAVVARICEMRLGRPDLATARILLAFSAFQALRGVTFPGPALLVHMLMWGLGGAAYWGLVMLLFRKPGRIAGYVLAMHFILYLVLMGGMALSGWVLSAEATAEAAKAAVGGTP